jgi:hypothetical protein
MKIKRRPAESDLEKIHSSIGIKKVNITRHEWYVLN